MSEDTLTATTLWQISGGIMNVIGAVMTLLGFLGTTYESYVEMSTSTFLTHYSSVKFDSTVRQTVSGVIGFVTVVLGFIEVSISYLPYTSHLRLRSLALFLLVSNAIIVILLFIVRSILINFYKALWLLNFYFKDIKEINATSVRKFMRHRNLNVQDSNSIVVLKQHAWKNWIFLYRLATLGR